MSYDINNLHNMYRHLLLCPMINTYVGLSDLIQSAKWHLLHGFLYLLFVRGVALSFSLVTLIMVIDPFMLDRLWNSFVEAIENPEVRSKHLKSIGK